MANEMKYLIVIVGPTAIGKTSLSIDLAKHYGCAILSCDSRQFYREMSIGTAAPNEQELAAAQHYFIHHRSITDNYTVGDFEKDAIAKLNELFTSNYLAILVGGSGLYLDAVLKGFDTFPEIPASVREQIQQQYHANGISHLQEQLKTLDPDYYRKLLAENPQTLQNPQRMMRFVEVCIGAEKPYSTFLQQTNITRNFVPIVIGLEAERDVLYDRINQRVNLMMAAGLIEEVQNLVFYKKLNALQTVGYKELFDYLDKKISKNEAVEEIKKNTRRFAKRQLTWFKRNEQTKWFDFMTNPSEIIRYIDAKMSHGNASTQ